MPYLNRKNTIIPLHHQVYVQQRSPDIRTSYHNNNFHLQIKLENVQSSTDKKNIVIHHSLRFPGAAFVHVHPRMRRSGDFVTTVCQ